MSETAFLVAIKSTLDKLANGLAEAQIPPIGYVDLDDATAVENVMASTNDAIIWEMGGISEAPRDPLYHLTFSMGARTFNDPSNYNILRLTGLIRSHIPVHLSLDIKDYSGVTATASVGTLRIISVDVNPQLYDKTSGIRLISITATAQRWL